jgi:hypothetical protein
VFVSVSVIDGPVPPADPEKLMPGTVAGRDQPVIVPALVAV